MRRRVAAATDPLLACSSRNGARCYAMECVRRCVDRGQLLRCWMGVEKCAVGLCDVAHAEVGVASVRDEQFVESWRAVYIDAWESLRVPWYITLGNHDHVMNATAQVLVRPPGGTPFPLTLLRTCGLVRCSSDIPCGTCLLLSTWSGERARALACSSKSAAWAQTPGGQFVCILRLYRHKCSRHAWRVIVSAGGSA